MLSLCLCGDEGQLHLQLHDQVVVGGALVDVLQGHNVLMLDPGKARIRDGYRAQVVQTKSTDSHQTFYRVV